MQTMYLTFMDGRTETVEEVIGVMETDTHLKMIVWWGGEQAAGYEIELDKLKDFKLEENQEGPPNV
jgi:hypothetical protein